MTPRAILGAVVVAVLTGVPLAAPAQLTKDQQKCAVLMASRLRGAAAARAKDVAACLQQASGGALTGGLAGCVGDDQPGRVLAAQAKVSADFEKRCTGESRKPPGAAKLPPFGVGDPTTIVATVRDQASGLAGDVLGADLDAAVIAKAADKNGASCQLRLTSAVAKCQDAQLREFVACLQAGVKSKSAPFDDAADIAACIGIDPRGLAAKRCDRSGGKPDAIRKALDKSCIAKGVDPIAAIPGCATSDRDAAHACLARAVDCRTCLLLSTAAGLGHDCDAADDGLVNLSCPPLGGVVSPFVVEVPPFLARVVADRASGVPGTTFTLRVEASVAIAGADWRGPGGFTATGTTAQVSLTQPGFNPVEVIVRDDQGRTLTTGIDLVVFDPSDTPAVASSITPGRGHAGTLVQLTSPALLDPGAIITVAIGPEPPLEPLRPALGSANIAIPFSVAAGIGGPTNVGIALLANGMVVEAFTFVVSPAPPLPGGPGDLTREVLRAVLPLVAQLRAALPREIADAGLTADELAVLLGTLDVAALAGRDLSDRALELAGQLEPSVLAAIDQVLVANGLPPDFRAPATAGALTVSQPALAGEALLRGCCFFHDVNDALQQATGALRFAAPLVALAGLSGGPVSGPLLVGFANAAMQLGNVADLAKIVAKIIPRVADDLVVTTSLSRIPPGSQEAAIIRVKGKLFFDIDICRDALDRLFAEMAKAAAAAVLPRVPLNTFLNEVWRRTAAAPPGRVGSITGQVSQELSDFLVKVIDQLAGGIVDLSGIDNLLKSAKVKICDVYDDQEIPIQPTADIVRLLDPGVGALDPFNADTVLFTCNPGVSDTVTIRAEYLCGFRTLRGEVDITCGEETCAEDAAGDLETILRQVQLLDQGVEQCENAPIDSYHVLTRTMGIKWKNTNPTRTIAISFVIKDTANATRYDTPPCVGAECDNDVGRCFTFLPPGATTSEVVYNCESTLDTPVVDGTNPCVKGPVMITEMITAHATYCDFESSNKDLFCEDVSRHLLQTETPHASFFPIQRACQ